jgi:hypothetical protein
MILADSWRSSNGYAHSFGYVHHLSHPGNELNVKCLRWRKEEARCSSHGGAAGRLVDAMCVDSTAHATPSIPPVCVVRVDRERGAYGTVGSRAGAGDQQVELLVPETPPSRALSALALNLLSVVFFLHGPFCCYRYSK